MASVVVGVVTMLLTAGACMVQGLPPWPGSLLALPLATAAFLFLMATGKGETEI
jgi:hypothetical protein